MKNNITNTNITENQLHELAILFMSQFSMEQMSLDEYLIEHCEELTDDERNLGSFILGLFDQITYTNK